MSPIRYLEWKNTLYMKFQHLKVNFVMFLSTKDEPNVLKSLEKEVILFLKSLWKTTVGFLYEA